MNYEQKREYDKDTVELFISNQHELLAAIDDVLENHYSHEFLSSFQHFNKIKLAHDRQNIAQAIASIDYMIELMQDTPIPYAAIADAVATMAFGGGISHRTEFEELPYLDALQKLALTLGGASIKRVMDMGRYRE